MGVLDDLTGKSAADKQSALLKQSKKFIKQGRDQGGALLEEAQGMIAPGVEDVLSRITEMQRAAKNDAYDAYQVELGNITQHLVQTGRYSTNSADASRLQALSAMQKTFTGIDSSLAGLYSNIGLQGLSMEVGQLNERAQFLMGAQQSLANVNQGTQYTGGGGLSSLLGAAGTAIGWATGGPIGGILGGSIGSDVGGAVG